MGEKGAIFFLIVYVVLLNFLNDVYIYLYIYTYIYKRLRKNFDVIINSIGKKFKNTISMI